AIAGLFLAWVRWGRRGLEADASLRRRTGLFYTLWSGKYFVDELYDEAVVNPVVEGSRRGLAPFDQKGIDGAVNGLAGLTRGLGGRLGRLQTGVVQTYASAPPSSAPSCCLCSPWSVVRGPSRPR